MEDDVTYITRKSYVEIVIASKSDWYGVVAVEFAGNNRLLVFCNWGKFLYKFRATPEIGRILSKVDGKCPRLYDLLTAKNDCFLMISDKEGYSGVGKYVDIDVKFPFLHAVTDERVLDAAEAVLRYSLDMMNEVLDKSPYEEWKGDLKKELL